MHDPWTLADALAYIHRLQPTAMEAGWCIMLGGSVLNQGVGNDLDLLAYPRTLRSVRAPLIAQLPEGTWSDVAVGDLYTYHVDNHVVELIFQTRGA